MFRINSRALCSPTLVLALLIFLSNFATAQTENVIHFFTRTATDGGDPYTGLVADAAGHLYGATTNGGAFGYGTVYQLTAPTTAGGSWLETVIHNFAGGLDGATPSGLTIDSAGNLYGTTFDGGRSVSAGGVVFKLTRPSGGSSTWIQTVLFSFDASNPNNAYSPWGKVVFDAAGDLYGVTAAGGNTSNVCGSYGCGTVYQLSPPTVAGGAWTQTVIYKFFGTTTTDGFAPVGLVIQPSGALLGTTINGGTVGGGTFFKLTPPAAGSSTWTESALYNFAGLGDGAFPSALTVGPHGVLYGTTRATGTAPVNAGTVFAFTPPSAGGVWTKSILHIFTGTYTSTGVGGDDGNQPMSAPVLDAAGNLYGTTNWGGSAACNVPQGCGIVYQLTPPAGGAGAWTETILHEFTGGHDGFSPNVNQLLWFKGSLFGTTSSGGQARKGVAFRIVP